MKKRYIVLIALAALLAARQLNTVPHREWIGNIRINTVETWDGSIYETTWGGRTIRSKHFEDLLPLSAR